MHTVRAKFPSHRYLQTENKLKVEKKGQDVTISCKEKAHFFRGIGHLFSHLEDADFVKEETVYVDCGRYAGLLQKRCSDTGYAETHDPHHGSPGMNEIFLYTEDTYELPEYPYFGAFRGRFSKEELKECDAYGELFGICLVPCIQTLAHLSTFLRWPISNGLQDNRDNLLPEEEKTYALIESC